MIHCTTYVNDQGQVLGYFMEFVNVTEEDKNGNIKPVIFSKEYTDNQGNPLGYFMEFVNVIEEDKNGNIKPVIFSKEYTDKDTMVFFAQGYSENYTVGIVYKTEVNPDYLA